MSTKKKHFYSLATVAVFLFIAAGSAKVNKIHCGAFNKIPVGEERGKPSGGCVILNDGSKVFGDKISWKTGMLVKDQIKVDNEKFAIRETRGYFNDGVYYGRVGSTYAKRIIHGKLNVYYTEDWVTTTSTSSSGAMRTTNRLVCVHYVQVGENGPLNAIGNQGDIKEYVRDCPKAYAMVDKKDKEIRRAIRKDGLYLNQVFITYNDDCK